MNMKEAFQVFGAKLKNSQWSCCAETPEGELVISLWQHNFKPVENGIVLHVDDIGRWTGNGATEVKAALDKAKAESQIIRTVIVHTPTPQEVKLKGSNRDVVKSFSAKVDWIGELNEWDGVNFEIAFKKEKK